MINYDNKRCLNFHTQDYQKASLYAKVIATVNNENLLFRSYGLMQLLVNSSSMLKLAKRDSYNCTASTELGTFSDI